MHERTRLRALTVSTVLLVLLAGCLGATGPQTGTDPTETPGDAGEAPYDAPPNGTVLESTLSSNLESAGSFTYDETAVIAIEGQSGTFSNNRTVQVDLESGRVLALVEGSLASTRETFRSANGETDARAGVDTDDPRAASPNPETVNATRYLRPSLRTLVDNVSLTYAGPTDGSRHVYEATGVEAVDSGLFADSRITKANVSEFEFRLSVDGEGALRVMKLRFSVTRSGTTQHVTRTVRYTDVGATTVERPDWVEANGTDEQ